MKKISPESCICANKSDPQASIPMDQVFTGTVMQIIVVLALLLSIGGYVITRDTFYLIVPGIWLLVNILDYLITASRMLAKKHTVKCSGRYAFIKLFTSGPVF